MSSWFNSQPLTYKDEYDVSTLWEYIESHGLGGVVGAIAKIGGIQNKDLANLGIQRYLSNMLHFEQSLAVCHALQDISYRLGFPIVFMKGPALVTQAYNDTGVRSYSDIDVFVGSYREGRTLLETLECQEISDPSRGNFYKRLRDPGKLHAWKDGWQIELCYPLERPSDPMAEFFCRLKSQVLLVSHRSPAPWSPQPEIHLLYLLLHLCWHFCSRYIWFLDIVSFIRQNGNAIDFGWIFDELKTLNMCNLPSAITRFCRDQIDLNLRILPSGTKGWNDAFFDTMLSVEGNALRGDLTAYHRSLRLRLRGYIASFVRFYLITDPSSHRLWHYSNPNRWSIARLLSALRLESPSLHLILTRLSPLVMIPFARFVALSFQETQRGIE